MKILLLVLVIFSLLGCVKKLYSHPEKPKSAFKLEHYECQQEAAAFARNLGQSNNVFFLRRRTGDCLEARGWVPQNSGRQTPETAKSKIQAASQKPNNFTGKQKEANTEPKPTEEAKDKLQKLKNLLDFGVITEDQYKARQEQILGEL